MMTIEGPMVCFVYERSSDSSTQLYDREGDNCEDVSPIKPQRALKVEGFVEVMNIVSMPHLIPMNVQDNGSHAASTRSRGQGTTRGASQQI